MKEVTDSEFFSFFYDSMMPQLRLLEKRRKIVLFTIICLILGIVIAWAITIPYIATISEDVADQKTLPAIGTTIFFISVAVLILKNYKSKIKKDVYTLLSEFLELNYSYQKNTFVNFGKLLNDCKIFYRYDYIDIDDVFSGDYKGLPFELAETDIYYYEGTGKNRRRISTFTGIILSSELKKKNNALTILKNDMGIFNAFNGTGLQRVKLEDVEFEKEFEIYSEDQIEARYILTTAFMDRLLKYIKRPNDNSKVQAIFKDNHVHLFISKRKNKFELSLFKPLVKSEPFKRVMTEIKDVLEITDELKLQEDIGL